MHSEMKNQRSSPARPFFLTSLRQALSFGRLAFHLARISLIFSRVTVSFDFFGVAAVAAGASVGAGVCAGAATIMADIRIAATMEARIQVMKFSPEFYNQKIRAAVFSVIQMPQHSGMPTKAQNNAACASKPPLPMPNEPDA